LVLADCSLASHTRHLPVDISHSVLTDSGSFKQ
jgi:hypothetical protein